MTQYYRDQDGTYLQEVTPGHITAVDHTGRRIGDRTGPVATWDRVAGPLVAVDRPGVDETAARIAAAGQPTVEEQVAALRAIDRSIGDPDADTYPYYTDRFGGLWKGVRGRVRPALSLPELGGVDMDIADAGERHGPLVQVEG
jgi:hypothetical protein